MIRRQSQARRSAKAVAKSSVKKLVRQRLSTLLKAFNPLQPRGDDGRWIKIEDIAAAAGNAKKEDALREKVTDPIQREKLDKQFEKLDGSVDAALVDKGIDQKENEPSKPTPPEGSIEAIIDSVKNDLRDGYLKSTSDRNAIPLLNEVNERLSSGGKLDKAGIESIKKEVLQELYDGVKSDTRGDRYSDASVKNLIEWLDAYDDSHHSKMARSLMGELESRLIDAKIAVKDLDFDGKVKASRALWAADNIVQANAIDQSLFWKIEEHIRENPLEAVNVGAKSFAKEAEKYTAETLKKLPLIIPESYRDKIHFDENVSIKLEDDTDELRKTMKDDVSGRIAARLPELSDKGAFSRLRDEWLQDNKSHYDDRNRDAVSMVIEQWANSSGDGSAHSVAFQHAVASKFGLDSKDFGGVDRASLGAGRAKYRENKEALDAIVDAMYAETQETLKKAGVEKVTLYRGLGLVSTAIANNADPDKSDAALAAYRVYKQTGYQDDQVNVVDMNVQANPASSYSTSAIVAKNFAQGEMNVMVADIVPREHILSTAFTGSGCLTEDEFIVLGHPGRQQKVMLLKHSEFDFYENKDAINQIANSAETEVKKSMRSNHRSIVLKIDAINYDWPKRTDDRFLSRGQLIKTFNPLQPRGDDGRWIKIEDIVDAKTDVAKADELRARVTDPIERRKLDSQIAGPVIAADVVRPPLTSRKKDFIDQIESSGIAADFIKNAYDRDDPQGALAVSLDADTVSRDDVEAIRRHFYDKTQARLSEQTYIVFRGDHLERGGEDFLSVSTKQHVAKFFAGKKGKVTEYKVDKENILFMSNLVAGTFDENEFIVQAKHLVPIQGDGTIEKWAIGKYSDPVKAANFTEWFGTSKMVDENGYPKVMYHGGKFDETKDGVFKNKNDVPMLVSDEGFFFTNDRSMAAWYAGNSGRVTEVYLRLQNPKVLQPGESVMDFSREKLKAEGHDGWIAQGGSEVVVFDSSQAKSVKNDGSFSVGIDDIRKALRYAKYDVVKRFDPNQPRDDQGRWVKIGTIMAAANDVQLADTLRQMVTNPEQREKLDRALLEASNAQAVDPIADYKANGVKSAAFKAWFGDWENGEGSKVVDDEGKPAENSEVDGSKVVDGEGKPVVVYHGTGSGGFTVFNKSKLANGEALLYGPGFYFTQDQGVADDYTEKGGLSSDVMNDAEMNAYTADIGLMLSGDYKITVHSRGSGAGGWASISHVSDPKVPAFDVIAESRDVPGEWTISMDMVQDSRFKQLHPDVHKFVESFLPKREVKKVYLNIRKPYDMDRPISDNEVLDIGSKLDSIKSKIDTIPVLVKLVSSPAYNAIKESVSKKLDGTRDYIASSYSAGDSSGKTGGDFYTYLTGIYGKTGANWLLQNVGYDGITHIGGKIMGTRNHRVWIAFEPNQIKSVDNVGTFDPSNADITKAFDPMQPRDDTGRWVKIGEILEAKGDAAKESKLRAKVTDPSERKKLDAQLKSAEPVASDAKPASKVSAWAEKKLGDKTKAANFAAWFKQSKVVDENGIPKVAYHGTAHVFDEFNADKGYTTTDKIGSWFGTDTKIADMRANSHAKITKDKAGQSIKPVYLSINNPLELETREALNEYVAKKLVIDKGLFENDVKVIFDAEYKETKDIYKGSAADLEAYYTDDSARYRVNLDVIDGATYAEDLAKDVRKTLAEYDGIHIKSDQGEGEAWVAFSSSQVKSATSNSGAYSSSDPKINKTFDPSQPRDDWGRWVRMGDIVAAKGDVEQEDALRARVTDPIERKKLDAQLQEVDEVSTQGQSSRTAQWASAKFQDPVKAENFTEWFDGSKIVDDNGEPLAMFHGTGDVFDQFHLSHGGKTDSNWFGQGFYFSPDPDTAVQYTAGKSPNMMKVYLSIKNPADWRALEGRSLQGTGVTQSREKREELIAKGYDGVVVYDEVIDSNEPASDEVWEKVLSWYSDNKPGMRITRKMLDATIRAKPKVADFAAYFGEEIARSMPMKRTLTEVVAFHPTQIKSATSNDGTYSSTDPRMNKAFNPAQPRGDDGRWIKIAEIIEAKGDVEKSDDLRARVTDPIERRKLDVQLASVSSDINTAGKPANKIVEWGVGTFGDKTKAENFAEWFGDSKIVDENGNPVVVYHGTNEEFDTFDFSKVGYSTSNDGHQGHGMYFSFDPLESGTYGNKMIEAYIRMRNPFIPSVETFDQLKANGVDWIDDKVDVAIDYESLRSAIESIDPLASDLLSRINESGHEAGWESFMEANPGWMDSNNPVDLNRVGDIADLTSNAVRITDYNVPIAQWVRDYMAEVGIQDKVRYQQAYEHKPALHWVTDLGSRAKEVTEVIKKLGYDGVIAGTEIVVFEPTQVKSATKNDGSYSPSERSFLKSYRSKLLKEWREELHPRGKDGRFIDKATIHEAALDKKKAKELMGNLEGDNKQKLRNALEADGMSKKDIDGLEDGSSGDKIQSNFEEKAAPQVESKPATQEDLDAKVKEWEAATGMSEFELYAELPQGTKGEQVDWIQQQIEEHQSADKTPEWSRDWEYEENPNAANWTPEQIEKDKAHHEERKKVHSMIRDTMKDADLDDEKKTKYMTNVKASIAFMPPTVLKSIQSGLDGVDWHKNVQLLTVATGRAEKLANNQVIAGCYVTEPGNKHSGKLNLDGDAGNTSTKDIYIHELAHVADWNTRGEDRKNGVGNYISASSDWEIAFKKELADGSVSAYGATSPSEGFAEFARYVWHNPINRKKAKESHPLCYEVFEMYGYV